MTDTTLTVSSVSVSEFWGTGVPRTIEVQAKTITPVGVIELTWHCRLSDAPQVGDKIALTIEPVEAEE